MGLNDTPGGNRIHIGFFGRRNAGKSSVVNAVTGQNLSIVADIKGTTTDPVYKSMELLPLGPVMIMDTPGMDDKGTIGALRVEKTRQVLRKTDIAILVVDAEEGMQETDRKLLGEFEKRELPYILVWNKCDVAAKAPENLPNAISVSAKTGEHIKELKEKIGSLASDHADRKIIGDQLEKTDVVVLVTPIDEAAPKGRMILPQMQTIRDILDCHAICMVTQTEELPNVLQALKEPPKLVVTDSQAFAVVKEMVPDTTMLTSFSILFARYKGILKTAVKGAAAIAKLKEGDRVLISEGCTHHRQCNDIGTVKLPGWIQKCAGAKLEFSFTSGTEFPEDLSGYALVVHCGGCMLNEREMLYRQRCAEDAEIPFTNYGTAIAYMNGILGRSLQIFPEIAKETKLFQI